MTSFKATSGVPTQCARRFSPISSSRHISVYMFGTLDDEFRCLEKDLRPSDDILNELESLERRETIADFIEISKHITLIYG